MNAYVEWNRRLIAWVMQAISELEPGQITGYLSAIFRDIIKLLAQEFGYDPSNIQAAPVCLCRLSFSRVTTACHQVP